MRGEVEREMIKVMIARSESSKAFDAQFQTLAAVPSSDPAQRLSTAALAFVEFGDPDRAAILLRAMYGLPDIGSREIHSSFYYLVKAKVEAGSSDGMASLIVPVPSASRQADALLKIGGFHQRATRTTVDDATNDKGTAVGHQPVDEGDITGEPVEFGDDHRTLAATCGRKSSGEL